MRGPTDYKSAGRKHNSFRAQHLFPILSLRLLDKHPLKITQTPRNTRGFGAAQKYASIDTLDKYKFSI